MPRPPFEDETKFKFDTGGLAGLFGGPQAVSAFAQVHGVRYRRYLGWYNSPGGLEVAKKYGQLANSKLFDGIFPGPDLEPAELFELSGLQGPEYIAAHSGTILAGTGHMSRLFELECESVKPVDVPGRRTTPECVTIAQLSAVPPPEMQPRLLENRWPIIAFIPIAVSAATCALCAVYEDWYTFSLILVGMLSNGLSYYIVGRGRFVFVHSNPADGAPDGNGVFVAKHGPIVVLGPEGAVNSITRGKFEVNYGSAPYYHDIGSCAIVLCIQFLAQILLIPQSTLFGQVLFLISLAVSWAYNNYCGASFDVELFQRGVLREQILSNPVIKKYSLGTRTTMATFVLLVLKPNNAVLVLNTFLPNESKVWRIWKEAILAKLVGKQALYFNYSELHDGKLDGREITLDGSSVTLEDSEARLLQTLLGDAEAAQRGYEHYCAEGSADASKRPGVAHEFSAASSKSEYA